MLYLDLVGVFNLDLAEVTGGVNEKPRLLVLFFIIKKKFNINFSKRIFEPFPILSTLKLNEKNN